MIQLPKPVYKPAFNVTRASHLVSRVRDLEASRAFYCDLLGMVVSDEDATTLWLRGLEEGCHHSLVLKQGEPAAERVGMRVLTEEDLDLLQAHFAAAGFPTEWIEVPFQGRTLHTTDPAGTPLEFCATMQTPPAPVRPRRALPRRLRAAAGPLPDRHSQGPREPGFLQRHGLPAVGIRGQGR